MLEYMEGKKFPGILAIGGESGNSEIQGLAIRRRGEQEKGWEGRILILVLL